MVVKDCRNCIYVTLENIYDDFATLKTKLTKCFKPKKNTKNTIYRFCKTKGNEGELDEYVTHL